MVVGVWVCFGFIVVLAFIFYRVEVSGFWSFGEGERVSC